MKLAARFEMLVHARRAGGTAGELNDKELVQDIISKYNSYKANVALKKWQISSDQQSAVCSVICGMRPEARQLVRDHLDYNKWEESGTSDRTSPKPRSQTFGCLFIADAPRLQ